MFSLFFWQLAFVHLQLLPLCICSSWKWSVSGTKLWLLLRYCSYLAPFHWHALLLNLIIRSARALLSFCFCFCFCFCFFFVTLRPGTKRILRRCMCCTAAGHSRCFPALFWILFCEFCLLRLRCATYLAGCFGALHHSGVAQVFKENQLLFHSCWAAWQAWCAVGSA